MPLTPELIEDASDRYIRERDRYVKLTRVVEDLCIRNFIEDRGLRVNITARTKSAYSFRNKLYRFMDNKGKAHWEGQDQIFQELSDFSGVRIALYSSTDAEEIVQGIRKIFHFVGEPDVKDKLDSMSPTPSFYKATHCQVALRELLTEGENENLSGLSCEIQICTMMEHVWNEIEHDIGYKPTGSLSAGEKEALRELGQLTRDGDRVIEKLLAAHEKRLAHEDRIGDEVALVNLLTEIFAIKRVTFRGNIGGLFETLRELGIRKGSQLKRIFNPAQKNMSAAEYRKLWKSAQAQIGAFNRFLVKNDQASFQLCERNSADPALFLVLSKNYTRILKNFNAGRGKGRPRKIRSLASRYKEFVESGVSSRSRVSLAGKK